MIPVMLALAFASQAIFLLIATFVVVVMYVRNRAFPHTLFMGVSYLIFTSLTLANMTGGTEVVGALRYWLYIVGYVLGDIGIYLIFTRR